MSFDYSINKEFLPHLQQFADFVEPGKARHLVSVRMNDCGQSALSMAIALKADDLFQKIIDYLVPADMPALMACTDLGEWTALHHAAVNSSNAYSRLKTLLGHKKYKQPMSHSPSFLRKISGLSKRAPQFCFNVLEEGKLRALSAEHTLRTFPFEIHPPKSLSYFPRGTPEILFEMWVQRVGQVSSNSFPITSTPDQQKEYSNFVERVYQRGIVPEIALTVITHDDLNLRANVGAGIVAIKAIAEGSIIAEYGGEYKHADGMEPGNSYIYEILAESFCFDGQTLRSPGSMFNHSFPNARVIVIPLPGRMTLAFKAIAPIKAGEQILISYGRTYFKNAPVVSELAPKSLNVFLEQFPPSRLSQIIAQDGWDERDAGVIHRWTYLLRDNGVKFLRVILENKMPYLQAKFFNEEMTRVLEEGDEMHPDELKVWRKMINPFLEQVPRSVYAQAMRILASEPHNSEFKAQQLKKAGHTLPSSFKFV